MNRINIAKCAVICDYIPVVSTVTSLVHIFNRTFQNRADYLSPYARYLNARTIKFHLLNLIPVVNIIVSIIFKIVLNSSLRAKALASALTDQELENRQYPYAAGPAAIGSKCFNNAEIIRQYRPSGVSMPFSDDPDTVIFHFPGNKNVVFQQASNGCTAGASCMLALDHGRVLDINVMRARNLSPIERCEEDLRSVGLEVETTPGFEIYDDFRLSFSKTRLADDMAANGPCITVIQDAGANVAHAIVIDAVNLQDNTATIRDPWHGWMIDVNLDALITRLNTRVQVNVLGERVFHTRFIHIKNKDSALVV